MNIKTKTYLLFLATLLFIVTSQNKISIHRNFSENYRRIRGEEWVEIGGVRLPVIGHPDAPQPEQFTITPRVYEYLGYIAHWLQPEIRDWHIPIMLVGESGVGKSRMIRYIAEQQKVPFYWIPMNREIQPDDILLGKPIKRVGEEGFDWYSGAILTAAQEGGYVLLDDANLAKPETLKALHTILDMETDRIEIIDRDGRRKTIKINPNFRIFVAYNEDYVDREELGTAFVERFVRIHIPEFTREDLESVLRDNLPPELHTVIEPMVDLYYFMRTRYMGKGIHPSIQGKFSGLEPHQEFSWVGEEYYFSLRDLLAMADYIKEFYTEDETLADTFGYAAKYAFRDRLESKKTAEGEDIYRLRRDFDEALASIRINGRRPDMEKILHYENIDLEEVFDRVFSAGTLAGWLEHLSTTEELQDTQLQEHLARLSALMSKRVKPVEIASYLSLNAFPEVIINRGLGELGNLILSTNEFLINRMRAVDILFKLSENSPNALSTLGRLYGSENLPPPLLIYIGAGLIEKGEITHTATKDTLKELALDLSYEDNIHIEEEGHKEEIVAKIIQSLGLIGIKDERVINRLREILTQPGKPIYRAKAAQALVILGKNIKKIKDTFLELADSTEKTAKETAGLIAQEAFTVQMLNNDIRQKIMELSKHRDLKIAIPAAQAALRLDINKEDVAETLRNLYQDTTNKERKLKIASILYKYGYFEEDEFLSLSYEYLLESLISKLGEYKIPYEIAQVASEILGKNFSEEIPPYESVITGEIEDLGEITPMRQVLNKLLQRFNIDLAPDEGDKVPDLERYELVITPTLLANLEKILPAIKLGHPVFLVGESGVTKTAILNYLAALLKQARGVMNLDGFKQPSDLVGSFTIESSGEIVWRPSELVEAAEGNYWIFLEEMNAARAGSLERMNTLLDREGWMEVPEYRLGYRVKADFDEGFMIFATGNPLDETGVKPQSPALINRFRTKWIEGYKEKELIHIMMERFELSEDMATRLVKLHLELVSAAERGDIGVEREYKFTLRRLIHLGQGFIPLHIEGKDWGVLSPELKAKIRNLIIYTGYSEFSYLPEDNSDRKFFEERLNILFPL